MASFDLSYDADDDVLEATFAVFDERFVQSLALNDHIFIFADPGLHAVWGLTLYSYARLLEVSETELTGLREIPDERADAILSLLAAPPAAHFFDLTDPDALIARVRGPSVPALMQA